MQRQLQDVIQSRYGVSSKTSNQVVQALAEIEKHRQGKATGLPGRPGNQQQQTQQADQMPSIETIVGGLSGGGGILGLIISLIKSLLGMGGSGQTQGNQAVMNILNDLMGGASHPNQAPDLASILLSLLGGSGTGTSSTAAGSNSNQAQNIEELMTGLLNGQIPSRGKRTIRKSK